MEFNPLCYAPFVNMTIDGHNRYAPCCVADKTTFNSPSDYWNSSFLEQIQNDLLNNKFPSICNICERKNKSNLYSEMDSWNAKVSKVNDDYKTGPVFLDYRPSNKCNLKCRMCDPASSNLIKEEVLKHQELLEFQKIVKTNENFDLVIDQYKNYKIKDLKVMGGEPSIEEKVLDFLNNVADNISPTPVLRFTTNATNLNSKFIKTVKRFDNVIMSISVDGVNQTYDYIRTNAKWEKTEKYIYKAFKNKIANTYIFNVVLSPYNIFNIYELLLWFRQLYLKNYKFHIYFIESEQHFAGLSCILPEHIESTLQQLYKNLDMLPNNKQELFNLIKIYESCNFNHKDFISFKKYNRHLDRIRETNILSLNNRFKNYVD